MPTPLPKWISIVSALIALLALFVGGSLYYSPETFIENTDFSIKEIRFLAYMWAARQVAIALVIGYALIKQSAPMLTIGLAAYCLMNIQDVLIGVAMNDSGLYMGAGAFSLLSASMILTLYKNKRP